MRDNMRGALVRLAIFTVVCSMGFALTVMVFAQLRFDEGRTYKAEFTDVTNLAEGNFVRIAGVEVGKVKKITITPKAIAVVEFSADNSVVLTQGTRAVVRWADLVGGRYLGLEEGAGGVRHLDPGDTIPVTQTEPALDLDTLVGGFRPLFRALNPEQVNALSGQLIEALQGQGGAITSFLNQTAALTNTLSDRDELIGQVIGNLNGVLGSLGGQSDQFAKTVDSLSQLVAALAARKTDISDAVAYANTASATIADLLTQARPPFQSTVHQTDRTAGIVVADHDYFDNLLNTLPDTYKALARQGMYGDFFNFYLCDAVLKVNGKGGQPVYVKVAGQSSGRCAPK